MKINKKKINFDLDFFEDGKYISRLCDLILEYLSNSEECDSLVVNDLINYFYDIKLENFDYVAYINHKYKTHFYATISIPTQMVIRDMYSEGHGRDFSWWTENYQRYIKAAAGRFIPCKDEYSFEEIQELIDSGKVYPIYPYREKTNKSVCYKEDIINYLVNYQSKELDSNDEYFDYMVSSMIKEIGHKTLINNIRKFLISLKLDSYIYNYEDMGKYESVVNKLISIFNEKNKNNKIIESPNELVINYLRNLPYEEKWYDEISIEQIIGVISMLDYDKDREVCEEVQALAVYLKEVELCYELALRCDWIDKKLMGEIVIQDGNPDFNYYFASEVEGADIKRHKEVILNSKYTDEYIYERTMEL